MTVFALTDAYAYVHGYDFTCDTNEIRLSADVAQLDATTFCSSGWTTLAGGLRTAKLDMSGFWQSAASAAPDPQSFPDMAVADRVYTVGMNDATPSSPLSFNGAPPAYMFQAGKFNYELGGQVGQLAPFKLGSSGTNGVGMKRGQLVAPKQTVTSTGTCGAVLDTLGFGVGAGAKLYATFHVFSAGSTITVQVQSDDNSGFTSPTTHATIGPITAVGGSWATPTAGAIVDQYYRLNVSSITGSFQVAGAIAIGV